MNPIEDYFLENKFYVYGGIDSSEQSFYQRFGREPRQWLFIENTRHDKYYPNIGEYLLCLGVFPGRLLTTPNGDETQMYTIKFITPERKIVLESCSRLSRRIMNKWKIAPEYFEQTV